MFSRVRPRPSTSPGVLHLDGEPLAQMGLADARDKVWKDVRKIWHSVIIPKYRNPVQILERARCMGNARDSEVCTELH